MTRQVHAVVPSHTAPAELRQASPVQHGEVGYR
jgi:hypothetical protein